MSRLGITRLTNQPTIQSQLSRVCPPSSAPPTLVTLSHDASRYINNAFNDLIGGKLQNLSPTCNAQVVNKLNLAGGFYIGNFLNYMLKGAHFYYGDDSRAPTKGIITIVQSPDLYADIRTEFTTDHVKYDSTGHEVSRRRTRVLTSATSFTFVAFFTRGAIHDHNSGRNGGNYAFAVSRGLAWI